MFTTYQALKKELGGDKGRRPQPMRPWEWAILGLLAAGMALARWRAH